MSWQEHKLGEFISIKHGWAFKGEHFAEDGQYLLLTPGNAYETGGLKLRPGKEKFYTGEFPPDFLMKAGDILVVMTDLIQAAPILGGAIVVPEDDRYLHNQRLGLVQLLPGKEIDRTFLYYVLNSPAYRAQVRGSATGATVRHTAPKRICDCTVSMPESLEEQGKVGAVLSAYDNLIVTNQRRIALLEEAARRLYREWFVHRRFPGHEALQVVDGVPEGWRRESLFEVAEVAYGFAFKAGRFNSEGVGAPVVRIRDIFDASTSTYTTEEADSSYVIERGDFLIGMDGIFHMNHWVGERAYLVQRVCRVRPTEEKFRAFIGLSLRGPIKDLEKTIQGATVAHLGAKHLKQIELLVPTGLDEELESLNGMLWQGILLREKNALLAKARDALLPKLMSSQLDVSGIPLPQPEAA